VTCREDNSGRWSPLRCWGNQLPWLLHRRLLIDFGERGGIKYPLAPLEVFGDTSSIGYTQSRFCVRFCCLHDIFVRRVDSVFVLVAIVVFANVDLGISSLNLHCSFPLVFLEALVWHVWLPPPLSYLRDRYKSVRWSPLEVLGKPVSLVADPWLRVICIRRNLSWAGRWCPIARFRLCASSSGDVELSTRLLDYL